VRLTDAIQGYSDLFEENMILSAEQLSGYPLYLLIVKKGWRQ